METTIPLLLESANIPIFLETNADIARAIDLYPYLRGSKMQMKNAICNALKNSEGKIECCPCDELLSFIPEKHRDKIIRTLGNPYVNTIFPNDVISLDVMGKELRDELITSIEYAANIFNRQDEEWTLEDRVSSWHWLRCEMKRCDKAINYGTPTLLSVQNSAVDDYVKGLMDRDNNITIDNQDINRIKELVMLNNNCRKYCAIPVMVLSKYAKSIGNPISQDLLVLASDILTNSSFGEYFSKPISECKTMEEMRNQHKAIFNLELQPKNCTKHYTNNPDRLVVNELIRILEETPNVKGLKKYSPNYGIVNPLSLIAINNMNGVELYRVKGRNYIVADNGVKSGILIESGKGIKLFVLECGGTILTDVLENLTSCGNNQAKATIVELPSYPLKTVTEAVKVDIDKDGNVNIKTDRFNKPMDNYSNLHTQMIASAASGNTDDMKMVLAAIMYNITEYDRKYHKLKAKGKESTRLKDITKARMFLKNDFARYYPMYLKNADENDFISFYSTMDYDKRSYTLSTDSIIGIKRIISTILR